VCFHCLELVTTSISYPHFSGHPNTHTNTYVIELSVTGDRVRTKAATKNLKSGGFYGMLQKEQTGRQDRFAESVAGYSQP